MEYAKILNGSLQRLRHIPHVSNPSSDTLASFANQHGYKPYVPVTSPGPYHTVSYTDSGEIITQLWTPLPLGTAQERAKEALQQQLSQALSQRVSIPCSLGYSIIYDQDALINAVGMRSAGYCAAYIDADDHAHSLNESEVQTVVSTLEEYRTSLYAKAQQTRHAVMQAATTAEVEQIMNQFSL